MDKHLQERYEYLKGMVERRQTILLEEYQLYCQLHDSVSLASAPSGFNGKGLKIKSGEPKFKPEDWKGHEE